PRVTGDSRKRALERAAACSNRRSFERRFGETVHWIHRVCSKPAWSEPLDETAQRRGLNRFRAIECDAPRLQIEERQLLVWNPVDAKIIGEIRPPTMCRTDVRDHL